MTLRLNLGTIEGMNLFSKLKWSDYLSGLIILFIILTIPLVIRNSRQEISRKYQFELLQIGVIPIEKEEIVVSKEELLKDVTAKQLIVTDLESGSILLEKEATKTAYPASTTKIMTALVARDIFNLESILQVKKEDLVSDNKVGFKVGEEVRVTDLLHAALISSSNEAAEVLAAGYEGGREGFVDLMNQKARDLHLTDTLFINPSGFDNENIYSTPRDLSILARELLKDDYLSGIVDLVGYSFTNVDESIYHTVYNTNQLLHEIDDVVGIKTGTTDGAGQVLVSAVERQGNTIIIVVMGSLDRYSDTRKIIDWTYSSFDWVDVDINNLID